MPSDPRLTEFCALFNAGRWFEAHETLEALWMECSGPIKDLLQALVQLAVALEHARRGNRAGALRVLSRARARWREGQEGLSKANATEAILDLPTDADFERLLDDSDRFIRDRSPERSRGRSPERSSGRSPGRSMDPPRLRLFVDRATR